MKYNAKDARMNGTSMLALLVLVLGTSPPLGQVKLEWKFQEGDTFATERIYTQKQTIDVKNKQFKQESSNTWITSVTVKEKAAAGHVVQLKVESVVYKTTGTAVPGGFDDKMAAKMKGAAFSATVTPQGKLAKFEGYEAFVQKLAEKNAELEKVLKVLLSEEAVREGLEETFGFLPDKAVATGDKWKREAIEPAPPFGSFKSQYEYTLEGDDGDEQTIAYTVKMTYQPPSADLDLFRVVKGGLRAEEGKGKIIFDTKKGRLVRGEKTLHLRGDLVIETMGNQTTLEFTSENSLRIRVK